MVRLNKSDKEHMEFYFQKIFKKALNLSYKRVRKDTAKKPDSEFYEEKKKELQSIYQKALTGEIDVVYFDDEVLLEGKVDLI